MKLPLPTFLLSIIFSVSSQSTELNKPIFLNDLKWPPFFFPNLENNQTGFGKEILTQCIEEQNFDISFKFLPIKRTHTYMQSGDIDVSIYSYNKNRESFVYYGQEPLFISSYGLASRKSDNITINKLSDITPYVFGDLAGLSHTKELRKIIEAKRTKDEVTTAYDLDAMFGQLLTNPQRFQIMASSKETLKWRSIQLNITEKVTVHDFTIKEKPYFVTVSKFSKNIKEPQIFLKNIDTCIKTLKENNTYAEVAKKYGL